MGLDLNGLVEVRFNGRWHAALDLWPFFGRHDYPALYDLVEQVEEEHGSPRLFPSNSHNTLNYAMCHHALDENHGFGEEDVVSLHTDVFIEGMAMGAGDPSWLSYDEFSRISGTFEPKYIKLGVRLIDQLAEHFDPANVRLVFWLW